MAIIIDTLFPERSSNNDKYIVWVNIPYFFIAAFIALCTKYYSLITFIIIYSALMYYYNVEYNKKIIFLNDYLDYTSYLNMDDKIIDFYYNNRWYIDYNLTAFRKSLQAVNKLLEVETNLIKNLMRDPEQHFQNAFIYYKEALNELHSSIYKMVSHEVNNDIFNDNLHILQGLLNKHMIHMKNIGIKCGYNKYDINIWSILDPNGIEHENDIYSKEYSSHYSFF